LSIGWVVWLVGVVGWVGAWGGVGYASRGFVFGVTGKKQPINSLLLSQSFEC
jgi:hypothetical protein